MTTFNSCFVVVVAVVVLVGLVRAVPLSVSSVCQSGIREDNTNYIYCARRGLNEVPAFSKNNVVYDELVLADNRIGELTAESFARIKVKKIFLNGNPVRRIDQTAFARLENHLEELWLDADLSGAAAESEDGSVGAAATSTSMVGLPRAIVVYLRNLNNLRLKGFNVKTLENSVLKRLNRLEILSLQFCSIEHVEANAFDGLRNTLKELYLDGNALQYVPTEALLSAEFKQLRLLSLSQNGIKTISADSFGFRPEMDAPAFLFSSSGFSSIENVVQQQAGKARRAPLTTLVKLDLSYNGLKLVDASSFAPMNQSLEVLLLQNNELNSFNLKFLKQLNVLRELNLDFNVITKLSANIFSNCQKLQFLSLQGNSIVFSEIAPEIGGDFYRSEQQQQQAPMANSVFDGLVGLQRLNLARNGIKHLPRYLFAPMRSLKSLILDKNPIDNLDEFTFDGLGTTLMNISLQNTKMKSRHLVSLKQLHRLERIKLGFNELDQLDWSIFASMHGSLTNLDAQNNHIGSIVTSSEAPLRAMESLLELDLSNNRLCEFNAELLAALPRLKNLGLSQNPLFCDCKLLPLYEWSRRKFDKDILSFIQWQCEVPASAAAPVVSDAVDYFMEPQSSRFNGARMRQFTSLTSADFVCSNSTSSRCLSSSRPRPATKMTNSFRSVETPSTASALLTSRTPVRLLESSSVLSSLASAMSSAPALVASAEETPVVARISNMILSSLMNTVLVSWELDSRAGSEVQGFKITYAELDGKSQAGAAIYNSQQSAAASDDQATSVTVLDREQRQYKIENLKFNTRYSICVSVLRVQGYDKYCRDIQTSSAAAAILGTQFEESSNDVDSGRAGKATKTAAKSKQSAKKLAESAAAAAGNQVRSVSSESSSVSKSSASLFSGLVLAALSVSSCLLFGLVVFVFVYVRRCRRQRSSGSKSRSKTAMLGSAVNTMTSKRNYSSAILGGTGHNTSSPMISHKQMLANAAGAGHLMASAAPHHHLDGSSSAVSEFSRCYNCETMRLAGGNGHAQFIQCIPITATNIGTLASHLHHQQMNAANNNKCPNEMCPASSSPQSSTSSAGGNFCSCIRLGMATGVTGGAGKLGATMGRAMAVGDTSTVSSTLSSVNTSGVANSGGKNSTNVTNASASVSSASSSSCHKETYETPSYAESGIVNDMMISPNGQPCWRMTTTGKKYEPNLLVPAHPDASSSTSPSSFTHFIIQSQTNNSQSHQQQQQQAPFGYLPYELYNCADVQQQQLVTLISGKNQSAPITTTTAAASSSNNSRLLTFIDKVKLNNQNQFEAQQPLNDHVYCEIPSTLSRMPPRDVPQQSQPQQFFLGHHQAEMIDAANMFHHFGHAQQTLKSPRGPANATLSTKYNASII